LAGPPKYAQAVPDRVSITMQHGGKVLLTWETRELLLAELRRDGSLDDLVAAFEAVGASFPVELRNGQDERLYSFVERLTNAPGSVERLPQDVWTLRARLQTEMLYLGIGLENDAFPDRLLFLTPVDEDGDRNEIGIPWNDKHQGPDSYEAALRSRDSLRDVVELIEAATANPIEVTNEQAERLAEFFDDPEPADEVSEVDSDQLTWTGRWEQFREFGPALAKRYAVGLPSMNGWGWFPIAAAPEWVRVGKLGPSWARPIGAAVFLRVADGAVVLVGSAAFAYGLIQSDEDFAAAVADFAPDADPEVIERHIHTLLETHLNELDEAEQSSGAQDG
jgi:hypothetical protein